MVFLSFMNRGCRIRLLDLGPFEAEEIVRLEPMAIVLRRPLIEHFDNAQVIAVMTFYCHAEQAIKHLKIYANKRELDLYEVDGDFRDYPYYIHPENILSMEHSGVSSRSSSRSSRSRSRSHSGTVHSHSGMSSKSRSSKTGVMRCRRCMQRCRRNCRRHCSSCLRRRLRRMSRRLSPMRRSLRRSPRRRSPKRRSSMRRRSRSRSRGRYSGTVRSYSGVAKPYSGALRHPGTLGMHGIRSRMKK
jgi:hypothetical protein